MLARIIMHTENSIHVPLLEISFDITNVAKVVNAIIISELAICFLTFIEFIILEDIFIENNNVVVM
jgi:hypothetical protein